VEHPENPYDLDLRAHIWRYDPQSEHWENLYVSPMIMGSEGFEVPLAIGFRGMTIHQGPDDPEPGLYVPTWSPRLGPGPVLLRSFDGEHFERISEPGLGDPTVTTIRSVVSFRGKLFIAPTGTTKNHFSANIPDRMVILAGTHLEKSDWQLACEPFFGDETNEGVFCMTVYNDCLYAGTANGEEGFQIWKTDGKGELPYQWTKVVDHGCLRGKENQGAVSMKEFKGKLYVGGGILGGYDRPRNIGPASPELIRISADDSWELLVGEARMTPDGLKVPRSGLGAGFGGPAAGYFWCICEHDGWLYLGTYDMTNWLPYFYPENMPRRINRFVQSYGIWPIVENGAGFDLWRSSDGNRWLPVSRNGFGNHCNFGIRTMVSSPYGMFVGAANPFGPRIAVQHHAGWQYRDNPVGGLEIWQGRTASMGGQELADDLGTYPVHRIAREHVLPGMELDDEAIDRLSESLIDTYYEASGFRHCGYWRHQAVTPLEACENLVEELLAYVDKDNPDLLEIGSGRGATTRSIIRRLPGAGVVAMVRSKEELQVLKETVPKVVGKKMNERRPQFGSDAFDYIFCMEGLSANSNLFPAICKALRKDGLFLFTDILFAVEDDKKEITGNIADNPKSYEKKLKQCGFGDVRLYDLTAPCIGKFREHLNLYFRTKVMARSISMDIFEEILARLPGGSRQVSHYLMGVARKGQKHREKKMINTTYEPFSRQQEYIEVNRGFIDSLRLKQCDTLLDLACGTGTLSDLLGEMYPVKEIVGLDLSMESLQLAAEHFADHPGQAPIFLQGTADCLPLPDKRFDVVTMGNSLHNLPDPDLLLREIGRVMKTGGTFAFNTSFFAGTFPPGTEVLYHEWLKLALGYIQRKDAAMRKAGGSGIKRKRGTSHRAFSKKWPTPDEFTELLERNSFAVKWFCHRTIMLNEESLRKVGAYSEMAKVLLSGYPVEIASEALDASVAPAFAAYGRPQVRRLWLEIVAEKIE